MKKQPNLIIGPYTYGRRNIRVVFTEAYPKVQIIVGKFCSIASNVTIYLGSGFHSANNISTFPFGYVPKIFPASKRIVKGTTKGNILIENDVWIGSGSTIMSGIHIGNGAVISTNSHVIRNVAPYSIVGGNPAQLIRKRFSDAQIDRLLKIKWWDWPLEKIKANMSILNSPNLEQFLKENTG